ncbi:hypothetical protein LUZ60_007195 [Juncus effusus]|nr:hypothetical protein LUZ60_007195 [Juncus effusus]
MEENNNNSLFGAQNQKPHFVLIPWLAPGHMIPMTDIAFLLAEHNASVTIITTPVNAARLKPSVVRFTSTSAAEISLVSLYFPAVEAGLPDGCENVDLIPSLPLIYNFYTAAKLFKEQVSQYIHEHISHADCIIGGMAYVWAVDIARQLRIPCFIFHGFGSFALSCCEILHTTKAHEVPISPSEPFNIPGLPFEFKIARKELPMFFQLSDEQKAMTKETRNYELSVDGVIVNSFEELEPGYSEILHKVSGKKVFTIGPVSLSHKRKSYMEERGNKSIIDASNYMEWLDAKKHNSVVYVSFGSTGSFAPKQFKELGLGLLASSQPFIWVIKDIEKLPNEESVWLRDNFEEKNSSRCLLIKGWAPQIAILSHPAIGGFLTHCGWNSTLESVAFGVPVMTWPLYSEQFLNEKLIVDVLKIGVSVGTGEVMEWRGDDDKVRVKKEDVMKAIETVMNGDEERARVRELKDKATVALEKGGSSYKNLEDLIHFVASKRAVN